MKYLIKKPDTFFSTINDEIEHVLHKSFDNMFPEYLFNVDTQGMTMPVDIQEFDNEYKIKTELPGIKKEDIDLDVTKSSLKIHAQKSEEKEENNKKYHKSEFRYGMYNRTIHFPQEINVDSVKAKLEHGILTLNLPKMQEEKKDDSKKINIE